MPLCIFSMLPAPASQQLSRREMQIDDQIRRVMTPSCHWQAAAIGQADVEASANCACTNRSKKDACRAFFINA
jgi:hypothetical protein